MILGSGLFVYLFTTFAVNEMTKAGATDEEIERSFAESITRFWQEILVT